MELLILSLAVLVCLFISIVNFNYQKEKYRYSTDNELRNLHFFEKPSTWRMCVIISAAALIITIFVCVHHIMTGYSNMMEQRDNIEQYQDDILIDEIIQIE